MLSRLRHCSVVQHAPLNMCMQLINLRSFNATGGAGIAETSISRAATVTNERRRDVRARSRRRNIFLQPGVADESLTALYGSGRFNDDEDEANFSDPVPDDSQAVPAPVVASPDGVLATLPPARNVRVKTAEFVKSSPSVADCPPAVYPEFAVIGRSNVGKSSLINMLTGRNALAMVSKTPGKTRLINHFIINGSWYLVDLPGYGYARASKEKVLTWNKFTREYFLERDTLASVLLLIDASIPPLELDVACANWLGEAGVAYTLVYTKLDKRKKGVPNAEENIAAFEAQLAQSCDALPPAVATSSKSGKGKAELLAHIGQLRALYHNAGAKVVV